MDQILEANAMQGRIDELLDAASYNRDRMARLESERDEALARYEAVADALGYVNHADGQGGRDVADPDTIIAAFRALERCADELREALDEREADMHMRIRAGYDKTVADCWRAKVAEVERERDEARAEVERLCSLLSETLPHVSHLCQTEQLPNSRHCSGCQHVSYLEGALSSNPLVRGMVTMPAEETFVINRLVDIDVAAVEAAASERAAIVAYIQWRFESLEALSYVELDRLVDAIESLDHHRDGGTP